MGSRSRLEIYLDLLQAVSSNGGRVDIARRAKLTLSDVENHLSFLVSQGLARTAKTANNRLRYELTSRGFEVLEAFQGLGERREARPLGHALSKKVKA